MKKIDTPISGLMLFFPEVFYDSRGYFFESFKQNHFEQYYGKKIQFVQENESCSSRGVLRGLHYQKGDFAQAKLVRVVEGVVLDIALDLRKSSPTFGKYFAVELSQENRLQFFIPRGFAHGFVVLSDRAIFQYKCDNYYNPAAERGILFSDPSLQINWILPSEELILSEKDLKLPFLENCVDLFD